MSTHSPIRKERLERLAPADCWNFGELRLKEDKWKRVPSWLVRWASRTGTRYLCSARAALVSPTQNTVLFSSPYTFSIPVQAAVLGHLSLSLCLWFHRCISPITIYRHLQRQNSSIAPHNCIQYTFLAMLWFNSLWSQEPMLHFFEKTESKTWIDKAHLIKLPL